MQAEPQKTVFVVDEDPAHRESLKWLIESMDYRVRCYASAQEFLKGHALGASGCLVIDAGLPAAAGLETAKDLAENGFGIPVILLVGPDAISTPAGAIDCLEKPVADQALFDRIRDAIGRN